MLYEQVDNFVLCSEYKIGPLIYPGNPVASRFDRKMSIIDNLGT